MDLDENQRRVIYLMSKAYVSGYVANSSVYPCEIVHSLARSRFLRFMVHEGMELDSKMLLEIENGFKKKST